MQFFEQWGPDFVKMRVINKKTKSAYMGYVSSYAKLENYIDTVDQSYVKQSKINLIKLSQKLISPSITP